MRSTWKKFDDTLRYTERRIMEKNRGYQLKDFEMETIILGNEESNCIMEIETFNKRIIKILKKHKKVQIIWEKNVEGFQCVKAKFPMELFTLSAGSYDVSEEHRNASRERMKQMQAKKKLEKLNANN